MTKSLDISALTNKFIEGKLTQKESRALDNLLLDKENIEFFKNLVQEDYLLQTAYRDYNTEGNLSKIIKEIENKQPLKSNRFRPFLKYAAAAVILLSVTSFWYINKSSSENAPALVEVSEKNIELILGNGEKQVITGIERDSLQNEKNTVIGYIDKDKLSYIDNNTSEELVYNTLIIPYGKTFKLELSDGTKVDLNSGSSLKYPVTFIKGQDRQVFITGEAYFDVTHDANDKFIVNANAMNIEVLGTEFNVSSYKEDATLETVLVEGSVSFYDVLLKNEPIILKPNEKASWYKKENTIKKTIINTDHYTAWRNGELLFKSKPFSEIAKKLERHFNITIKGISKELAKEKFAARFKGKTINQIMIYFSESYGFKYTVNGDIIEIK